MSLEMNTTETEREVKANRIVQIFYGLLILGVGVFVAYFVYTTTIATESRFSFKLGLDLAGGSHLIYQADVSGVQPQEVPDAMTVLRDVIERRTNIFEIGRAHV